MAVDPTFKNDFHQAMAPAGLDFTPLMAQTVCLADTELTRSLVNHEGSLAAHCFYLLTIDARASMFE